jgi:hypothetical protein
MHKNTSLLVAAVGLLAVLSNIPSGDAIPGIDKMLIKLGIKTAPQPQPEPQPGT